eukprot:606247-Pyramimonas_sp.AAC.1
MSSSESSSKLPMAPSMSMSGDARSRPSRCMVLASVSATVRNCTQEVSCQRQPNTCVVSRRRVPCHSR